VLSPSAFGLLPPLDGTTTLDEDETAMGGTAMWGRTPADGDVDDIADDDELVLPLDDPELEDVVEIGVPETPTEVSTFVVDIVAVVCALDVEPIIYDRAFKVPQFPSPSTLHACWPSGSAETQFEKSCSHMNVGIVSINRSRFETVSSKKQPQTYSRLVALQPLIYGCV
jgi:hypothetical protein